MNVLGIETTCDETAAAVVNEQKQILGHGLLSQIARHVPYGGVVPEVAAREHLEHIDDVIKLALEQAQLSLQDLDAIAVTAGPGLIGGVMVGLMVAKTIAAALNKPFIAVNHLEAHALTARLEYDLDFPFLLLLVSGGHTQFILVKGVGYYQCLGSTVDDALGECFDKSAKLMGLGYPGGPALEQLANTGDQKRFVLPRPMWGQDNCQFSFSGLKTAVRQLAAKVEPCDYADLAASFQATVAAVLADRLTKAAHLARVECPGLSTFVVAGGVAANQFLAAKLQENAKDNGLKCYIPSPALCTDNGIMVAWAGLERYRLGLLDGFDVAPRPRWPLEEVKGSP